MISLQEHAHITERRRETMLTPTTHHLTKDAARRKLALQQMRFARMKDARESLLSLMELSRLLMIKSDIDLYNKERIAAAKQSGKHAGEKSLINYDKRSKMTRDYGTGAYDGRRNKDEEKPVDTKDKKYIDIYKISVDVLFSLDNADVNSVPKPNCVAN